MPSDMMSSEPRRWMVFGQLAMPVQCLGTDDIMSLGINSFATKGVGTKNCSGNSPWISGFTMDFWIYDGFWYQDSGTRII